MANQSESNFDKAKELIGEAEEKWHQAESHPFVVGLVIGVCIGAIATMVISSFF